MGLSVEELLLGLVGFLRIKGIGSWGLALRNCC